MKNYRKKYILKITSGFKIVLFIVLLAVLATDLRAQNDILINDFENGYGAWLTEGIVFERPPVGGQYADILITIRKGDAEKVSLNFGGNAVTYDFTTATLDKIPVSLIDGKLKLRVLVDRPMFEVIANDGQIYRTAGRNSGPLATVSVKTKGGSATVESLKVYKMKSIWKK